MQNIQQTCVLDQEMHRELQRVIWDNDILIQLQPIVSLETHEVVGYETLARGLAGSGLEDTRDLFATASKYGVSDDLEYSTLVAVLNVQHKLPEGCFLSINVGSGLFLSKLFSEITNLCQHIAHQIVFELTEHVPFTELTLLEDRIRGLKEMGYRIALSDTARGFAGIERARKLKPSVIKLCQPTVARMISDKAYGASLSSVFKDLYANHIRLQAEGIEQQEQILRLTELGVTLGQGDWLGDLLSLNDVLST